VREELHHLVAPHLAVHDHVEARALVFLRDEAGGVVFGFREFVRAEVGVGVLVEVVRAVEPLRLRVGADDGRQQEVVVRGVVGPELLAVGGRGST